MKSGVEIAPYRGGFSKRLVDIFLSAVGLFLLFPVLLAIAVLIKLDSAGPVFFRQERIGRGLRAFRILKFRTMVPNATRTGVLLTAARDPRITRVGGPLRKMKLDELPQFLNVLRGEMSLVGPRPEVRRYVDLFRNDYEEILRVRPGLTDLASLKYRHEQEILAKSPNPEHEYVTRILPDKVALAKEYVRRSSFMFDMRLIARTIVQIFMNSHGASPAKGNG